MKDKKKWLDFVHKHFAGMGIGAVTVAMALTVAKGVSGQGAGFDPGDIDTSMTPGTLTRLFLPAFQTCQTKRGMICPGKGKAMRK